MGCNFCTTSAFFGGKGKYLNFYDTGKELFEVMCEMEGKLEVKSFFMMDENFLLHKRRAMELLELMKAGHKAWSLYVFSSANAISQYTMRELVELGVSWIWMGLESPRSSYTKLKGADTLALTRELRRHGIKLLGSTIVGLEHHTPENIEAEIEHAVAHDTDFHQFMLYTPVPGTPLFFEMKEQGRMLPGRQPGGYPRAARIQFPARGDFARRIPSTGWIAPSAAISSATAPAFTASAAPRWTAAGSTRTTPMRGCASGSRARLARWGAAMRPRSGRWNTIFAAPTPRLRRRFARCDGKSGASSGWSAG